MRRAMSMLNKLAGYGLSMLLLAVASLIAIPAMILASGNPAWGAIALGQGVGGVGSVLIGYGWWMSGPADIATGDATSRRLEFTESLKVRLVLLVPVMAVAALISWWLAPVNPELAVLGAITAALPGLTANWYFVGLARPYAFLVVETLPRLAGTVVGIAAMTSGADAGVGLLCQGAGLLAAFVISSAWIFRHLARQRAGRSPLRPLTSLLRVHGAGLASGLGGNIYSTAPLVIVTVVAPSVQPVYALVDKLQRQISVGLGPLITVLQGWVPRAADPAPRARRALWAGAGATVLIGILVLALGPLALRWLGAGSLQPGWDVVVLMTGFVTLNFYTSVISRVVLATYHRLDIVAKGILAATIVALPLVAVGAWYLGPVGALLAVNLGLLIRLGVKIVATRRCLRSGVIGPSAASDVTGEPVHE